MRSILSKLFDPEICINSGQVFLWEKVNNSWYGIHKENVLKFTLIGGNRHHASTNSDNSDQVIEFFSFPELKSWEYKMFRLDDDLENILADISRDSIISRIVRKYPGLRLIRQDPEQCILSFVCASNTSISMIRKMLLNLSRKFGSKVIVDGREFFTFPSAHQLNKASGNEIHSCGLGYRTKALMSVANAIATGTLDFDLLINSNYLNAKQELLKIYGIGEKIADCILLFSLEKLDAFPIDIWITRALLDQYTRSLQLLARESQLKNKINPRLYRILSEKTRSYFGKYAGYAQQYLFVEARDRAGRKW